MINSIIQFSIKNKIFIVLLTLSIVGWGLYSLKKIPIDAVPDITNNQVQIITTSQSLAAQEVEQFLTYPVELAMANIPGVTEIRSISRFGLSVVTVVFEEDMGTYLPRQLVAEKINEAKENIGEDLGTPQMGPITTGLGEIYQYSLEVDDEHKKEYSPADLRTIQDWIIKRQLSMIEGVVEISSWGGFIKQYEVAIDPAKLNSYGLTLSQVYDALANNNQNSGGSYIEKGPNLYYIRGRGLAQTYDDIRSIVVEKRSVSPITIGDIATVGEGHAPRYGAATKDGEGETVIGIVMMLKGANSAAVIDRVKERVAEIQSTLPEGVSIKPFLDRTKLVEKTTGTITENLIIGGLIVILALVFLLGTMRSGLIVASVIPLSMLFALGMMNTFGVSANLMSLGALDFGIIVDGAVIIVEFMVVLLIKNSAELQQLTKREKQNKLDTIAINASSRMMNSAIFGQIIILIVFIPILTLTGIEGKTFIPMALTFGFAIIGAMILCLTYVPMVTASSLYSKRINKKTYGDKFMEWMERKYQPIITQSLKIKGLIITIALVALALAAVLFTTLGGEFIPQLDEGDFALETRMSPGTSLEEMTKNTSKLEAILLDSFPEVETVVTKIGAGAVPTDPMPVEGGDVIVSLKEPDEWVSAESKQELAEKMEKALSILPGVAVEFSQPIEMRFNELMTGIKQDIAVKIYGDDLDILQQKGNQAAAIIRQIPGASDVKVEQVTGLPQIIIDYNRKRIAEYGLNIADLNHVVSTAFAGGGSGKIFEGEKRFDLVVRLKQNSRNDIESVKNLYISTNNGSIPLREVAEVSYQEAPAQISRDNTHRRIVIGVNVRNRDTQSLVNDMQTQLRSKLKLPTGYSITFGGEFENLERAQDRLQIVVPIALALIFVILFINLRSAKQTLLIYTAIPFSAVGGIIALWLRGMPFSISAGVGFIALFGVAVLNGLVLISSLNDLKEEGVTDIRERIKQATTSRLRPIFLTAVTDILGFLPMAISSSAGAEVQRPLATVVIGGLFSATLLTLVVLPVLYSWLEKPVKLNKPALATAVIIALAFTSSYSQTLSIEEAQNLATESNPSLKASAIAIEKSNRLQKTAFNPDNTNVFYGVEERSRETGGQEGTESIGLSQQIDFPTAYVSRSKMLKQQTVVQEKAYQVDRAILLKEVNLAYAQWINAWQKVEFYQQLDSLYQNFEKAANIRYETGESSGLERLNAQSKRQEISLLLSSALADETTAFTALNQLLNNRLSEKPSPSTLFMELETKVTDSFADNPFVSYQQQKVTLAEKQLKAQQSQWLPGLKGQYTFQNMNGQNGYYGFQVGLTIPLFFGAQQAKMQASRLEIDRQNMLVQNQKLAWNSALLQAGVNYEQQQKQLKYYQNTGLPLSKQLFEGASLSFTSGDIDYVEYLQSITQASTIKTNWFDALLKYNQSIIEINFLNGSK
ncbi:CusA/CzcA family heavy metal efflux RND transporter [Fulvivirga sediminis]|uniref:CusA/CzcA family heavy metal efflux RND transporter n=1 Tax=Fulvivirga sediminis TaxID=2803949 RepID=A0A937F8B5_9BACT|nr:CusA/CzcA family heavy metal efflux RND transporter [Fulvivirga sediminis]MBL3656134.1 CusA/CzcA family heavy metal efflux RND transporter [Fulvivirga sediminis]